MYDRKQKRTDTRDLQPEQAQSRGASRRTRRGEGSRRTASNQRLQQRLQEHGIQPNLTVSEPDDKYEEEAERVAETVMQMPDPTATVDVQQGASPEQIERLCSRCQRHYRQVQPLNCGKCEEELAQKESSGHGTPSVNAETRQRIQSLRGGGRPLSDSIRSFFEPRFGHDFSDVRVHTGTTRATALNRTLDARAITNGNDVYFRRGEFQPDAPVGRRLLAHELTHVVQQTGTGSAGAAGARHGATVIQRNVLENLYEDASGVVEGAKREAGEFLAGAEQTYLGSALARVYDRAISALGMDSAALLSLLRSLDTATLQWLATAEPHVWDAIAFLDSRAFRAILRFGRREFETIAIVGENLYTFLTHLPFRLWRLVIHGWEAIVGPIDWLATGLARAALAIERAVPGTHEWLVEGRDQLRSMVANAIARGAPYAREFVRNPSRETLLRAVVATVDVPPASIESFAEWGVEGYAAAKLWARGALQGLGRWLYDAIASGLRWAEDLLAYLIDLSGLPELAQISYGMAFSMRPLKRGEVIASKVVHPSWFVPYNLVRVDEHSVLAGLSDRAFVSFHIVHFPKGMNSMATMVHELTHVGQYDASGSVYIPGALHAQAEYGSGGGVGSGSAYDFERTGPLADQRSRGRTMADLNPEAQAQLCEYYYVNCRGSNSGGPAASSCSDFQPWLDDLEHGWL